MTLKGHRSRQYGADLSLPGMLIGRILRSPYPHAKIVKMDTSKAKALPGVEAVITFEDVPKLPLPGLSWQKAFQPLPIRERTKTNLSYRTKRDISETGLLLWLPLILIQPNKPLILFR